MFAAFVAIILVFLASFNAGSSKWIKAEKRGAIYARDGFKCQWCLKDLSKVPAGERHLDHVIDTAYGDHHQGSTNYTWNLITACHDCNTARGKRNWLVFALILTNNDRVAARAIIQRIIRQTETDIVRSQAGRVSDLDKVATWPAGTKYAGQSFNRISNAQGN